MAKLTLKTKYVKPTVCVRIVLVDSKPNRYEIEVENERGSQFWGIADTETVATYDTLAEAQDNFESHARKVRD